MAKINLTYDEFDNLLEQVDSLAQTTTADEYVPEPNEIEILVKKEPETALVFLMWIDETGIEIPENKENRAYLREWLRTNLIISGEKDSTNE